MMGPPGFEPGLRAPKARRIPSYPTVPNIAVLPDREFGLRRIVACHSSVVSAVLVLG